MTDPEEEVQIHRILVALDGSAHSMAALEAAVQLAAELHAELTGLFVEDADLLRMAELPITREVGSYTAVCRELDRPSLERQLRTLRAVAERALTEAAEHARVRYTFRVVRGSVLIEVLRAASEADLVTLGHLGWSPIGRRGVGSTARHAIHRSAGLVLVARHGFQLGAPVHVAFDGSRSARQALGLSARLAAAMDGGLTVLIPGDRSTSPDRSAGSAARLAAEAADLLKPRGIKPDFRILPTDDPAAIAPASRAAGAGAVVLPMDGEWLAPESIQHIVGSVSCPVLVVRLRVAESPAATDMGTPSAA
jgi:nucleotide-binding universal stress UspA family protein